MTPFPWQTEAVASAAACLRAGRSAINASDTGTGKTVVTCLAAREVGARLAVVSPRSVIPAWTETAALAGVPLLFCTNIEQLKTGKHEHLRRRGRNWTWRIPDDTALVFDEVHGFAAPDSQNGLLLAAAPRPSVMLSATAADSPLRFRGIGHQLGLFHWSNWEDWLRAQGATFDRFGGWRYDGDMAAVHASIREQLVRIRIADLGDQFPSSTIRTAEVEVDMDLQHAYMEELRQLHAEAETELAQLTRARQMAEFAKLDPICEMARNFNEQGRAVAIFLNYKDSVNRVADALGALRYHGDMKDDEREANRRAFQANENLSIVISLDCGGQSLSVADVHGNFPLTTLINSGFSATKLIQAFGRGRRANGKSHVDQIVLFAAGVQVEQRIRAAVERKKTCIETLNDGDLAVRC